MHFVGFIVFVQQMHNILGNNYLFLIALVRISMFACHPQGISCYVC